MRRSQLDTNDWEDLKNAKVVEASLEDIRNLDIDDDTLSDAIDEAVETLSAAGRGQKSYVVLAITGVGAPSAADDEGEDDDEEETEGARSGHPKRGEQD